MRPVEPPSAQRVDRASLLGRAVLADAEAAHEGGALRHVDDAIAINKQRRPLYEARTGGRSRWVSLFLILSEMLLRPVCWLLDLWARHFHKRGIPIVAADFVPMRNLRPVSEPPPYRGVADASAWRDIKTDVSASRWQFIKAVWRADWQAATDITYGLLRRIQAAQDTYGCLFSMTRHLCESMGFAALHAEQYAIASRGGTRALSTVFLTMQALGLGVGVWLDRKAQKVHAEGVGIIENDVPHIPFAEQYCAARALRP